MNKEYYFAYGSNMSKNRMIERGVKFKEVIPGRLVDYELRFNKVSKKQGAVANVMYKYGSIVEGVLYQIEDIKQMDKYEGFPKHYDRTCIRINSVVGYIVAWVYIAQPEHIQEGLKPSQEYLNYLLEGKQYLSEEYYEKLTKING